MKLSHAAFAGALTAAVATAPVAAQNTADTTARGTSQRVTDSLEAMPAGFDIKSQQLLPSGYMFGFKGAPDIYRTGSGVYVCTALKSDRTCEFARITDANPWAFTCFRGYVDDILGGNRFGLNFCDDGKHVWDGNNGFKRLDHIDARTLQTIEISAGDSGWSRVLGYTSHGKTYDAKGTPLNNEQDEALRTRAREIAREMGHGG